MPHATFWGGCALGSAPAAAVRKAVKTWAARGQFGGAKITIKCPLLQSKLLILCDEDTQTECMRRRPRCGDDVDMLGLGVAQVWAMVGQKIRRPPWSTPVFSIILWRDGLQDW